MERHHLLEALILMLAAGLLALPLHGAASLPIAFTCIVFGLALIVMSRQTHN